MSLRIAEIFTSIQGEGRWIGVPSTFIRVSGCNMRCVWCDTPYASWKPEGPKMNIEEIVAKVDVKHVVLTGGEPMLFDVIEPLIQTLKAAGHIITVETAGTVFRDVPVDLMSISPKLANSTPPEASGWAERHERTRLDVEPLKKLINRYDYQLKFVLQRPEEVAEIEKILALLAIEEPDRIFLMAEGIDREILLRRQKELVPVCLEKGWRLAPRLHIDLFGDTKGT